MNEQVRNDCCENNCGNWNAWNTGCGCQNTCNSCCNTCGSNFGLGGGSWSWIWWIIIFVVFLLLISGLGGGNCF
ncbi:MAG: hypothetical protein IIW67_04490 [Peptococcaceae bacterium]|nr:hypothetical protein [Peptococcaceae bacterium]MBQ2432724.1 hypothetical protein [Peptococcaceae bacterium]MBQ5615311.1 hypothetical protein [Peptococcaceae bacterium]MBQ5668978.1 hypothetical protein [Peptococcaceae bacterium]MBQ5862950.1 hypothetical protein [Peptococcaceae bacterium]